MDRTEQEQLRDAEYAITLAIDEMTGMKLDLERGGYMVRILAKARTEAVTAMKALIMVEPHLMAEVMNFQNEVRRYTDLCRFVQTIIGDGEHLAAQITAEETEHIIRSIYGTDDDLQEG